MAQISVRCQLLRSLPTSARRPATLPSPCRTLAAAPLWGQHHHTRILAHLTMDNDGAYFYGMTIPKQAARNEASAAAPAPCTKPSKQKLSYSSAAGRAVTETDKKIASDVAAAVAEPPTTAGPTPDRRIDQDYRASIDSDPRVPVCTFFQKGMCMHGVRCRFRHTLVDEAAVQHVAAYIVALRQAAFERHAAAEAQAAAAAAAAEVAALEEAQAVAAAAAAGSEEEEWDEDEEEPEDPLLAAMVETDPFIASVPEDILVAAERLASEQAECGICLEQPAQENKRFGILPACPHVFCLECIRKWRSRVDTEKWNARSCPLCRRISYFLVPGDRLPATPARAAKLTYEYKQKLASIHCAHFARGDGECPFGSSCFYLHMLKDGTVQEPTRPRLRMTADGTLEVMKSYKLSDYLV